MRMSFWAFSMSVAALASATPLEPVTESSQLPVLCESRDAETFYFTDAEGFSFAAYRSEQGTLPLDISRVTALSGALHLKTSPQTLQAKLSPEAAKRITELFSSSLLAARIAFRLDTSAPCTKETTAAKIVYQLPVEILLVEISRKSNGRPLLRYETDLYRQVKAQQNAKVLLTEPSVLEGELPPKKLSDTLTGLVPALRDCYAKALSSNLRAQGTLTVRLWLEENGTAKDAEITIDTLGSEEAQRCVKESLRAKTFPNVGKASSFSFTIYFLQD